MYYSIQRLTRTYRLERLVWPDTDVCIEGPPGSGNTFFVAAFSMANPGARVADHHHVVAQVKRAISLGIPAVSLLRDPVDCAFSRASAWRTPDLADTVLKQWIAFFATDLVLENSVLASFETLTASPGKVIGAINERFGSAFDEIVPAREEVFAEMDQRRSDQFGAAQENPNRPDPRRPKPPSEWRAAIAELPEASKAVHRYEQIRGRAL
jgi:hypothetical protein